LQPLMPYWNVVPVIMNPIVNQSDVPHQRACTV
jgi:hypothetical protein